MNKRFLILSLIPMMLLASCGDKKNNSGGSNAPKETTVTTNSTEKKTSDKKDKETKQRVFTYNTEDYVLVTMNGYKDGEASLEFHADKKNFFEKVNNDIYEGKATSRQLKQYENAVEDSVTITADKDKELKNGDVINIKLEANNEHLIHYCVQFSENTFQYTVHGLTDENGDTDITLEEALQMYPDAQVLDPFEKLHVVKSDIYGVNIYNDNEYIGVGNQAGCAGFTYFSLLEGRAFTCSADMPPSDIDIGDILTMKYDRIGVFSYIEDGVIVYPIKKDLVVEDPADFGE